MLTTAIYIRVSTDNGQQNFDSQLPDLNRWIELHKPESIIWYKDKFTGRTMDRPGMKKLISDLHSSKLCQIVCWRLDRLGRTAAGLTKFFEDLQLHDCNLISLKDNLDLSTPAGRLNANIIASVSAYETEIRAERIAAGQAAARTKGKKWGGSPKGTRKNKTIPKVKSVLALLSKGMSKAEISRVLKISIPTIYNIIEEEQKIG